MLHVVDAPNDTHTCEESQTQKPLGSGRHPVKNTFTMSLPGPSALLLAFKTKIEEAVRSVPEMAAGEKLKAVQFWNMVSERLQDIVNNSAADINALAMKMAKEGAVEELPLIDDQELSHSTSGIESPKDFIVAPSFVPANEYEDIQIKCYEYNGESNPLEENLEPPLKSELHLKDPEPVANTDSNQSLPPSPAVLDHSFSSVAKELASSAKENYPLLKSELSLTHITKKGKKKRPTLKKISRKMLRGKLRSELKTSRHRGKGFKRKDVMQVFSMPCSPDDKDGQNPGNNTLLLQDEEEMEDEDGQSAAEIVVIQSDCSNVLKALTSPPFVCEWCNTEFYSSSALTSHQWIHVKPYACAECTARFSTKGNLIVHQRSHTGEKPFHCDQCDASFSTKSNLRRHAKTHTGEKPWECMQCGKRYTEKKSLKVHLRRHTGEKPYQCQICFKHFSQTGILQTHMALHLGQKTHLCEKCGKSFRQNSQLRLHKLRHEGVKKYNCQDCPREFLTKGDLERHKRVHTGERPFTCEICGKTYTRQQSLNEHLNKHYGLKPYECKYCTRKFSEMSACYKHIKHHEEKKKKEDLQTVSDFQNLPSDDDEEMTFEVCESTELVALS